MSRRPLLPIEVDKMDLRGLESEPMAAAEFHEFISEAIKNGATHIKMSTDYNKYCMNENCIIAYYYEEESLASFTKRTLESLAAQNKENQLREQKIDVAKSWLNKTIEYIIDRKR